MKKNIASLLLLLTITLLAAACTASPAIVPTDTAAPLPPTHTDLPPTEAPEDTPLPPTEPPPPTETEPPPTPEPTEVPPTPTPTLGPFELSSNAFVSEETIPPAYACHGADVSPELEWTEPPEGTQSFALIMDDPDAVQVVGFVWDHWLLFNIPAETRKLPGEIPPDGELPDGSRHGMNSFPRLGYDGPCPPSGRTHRYVFTLYALDTLLDLEVGSKKEALLAAMKGHILAETIYAGNYTSP